MTIKWKEVSPYSGQAVEEDAPTNFAGQGSKVAMPPDALMKKKKKTNLLDARTKAYREHRAKLDAARQRRLEQKKSSLAKKVQENIMDFNREIYLEENNMNVLKDITLKKQAKPVKFKDGTMKVDLFTASAITQVYNKVNMDNKKKLEDMVNGTKSQFAAMSNKIMKMVGK
jgi:hypothetical protein|tara:strand:+ start:257 stop:769 length:513 start_codon:yes stop_codon:yes gene_type:complete